MKQLFILFILISIPLQAQIKSSSIKKTKKVKTTINIKKPNTSVKVLPINTTVKPIKIPSIGKGVRLDARNVSTDAAWLELLFANIEPKKNTVKFPIDLGRKREYTKFKFYAEANTRYLISFNVSSHQPFKKFYSSNVFFEIGIKNKRANQKNQVGILTKMNDTRSGDYLFKKKNNIIETIIKAEKSGIMYITSSCHSKWASNPDEFHDHLKELRTFSVPYTLNYVEIKKL
jgi:hypothetical protein